MAVANRRVVRAINPGTGSKLNIARIVITSILLFGGVEFAWSQEKIGGAQIVINNVQGNRPPSGTQTPVVQGDNVFLNEFVRSGVDSKANLVLVDNSNVSVGPGSTIKLDNFIYSGPQQPGTIVVNMTKGTLRFVTGYANKRAYTILTPNAAIGVRGTILRIEATATETRVINEEGTAIVCRRPKGQIVTVEELRRRCGGREERQANLTLAESKKCPCTELLLPNQEATVSTGQILVADAPLNAISDPIISEGFAAGFGAPFAAGFTAPLGAAALVGAVVAAGAIGTAATATSASFGVGSPPPTPLTP
jgi:hypothetical protein